MAEPLKIGKLDDLRKGITEVTLDADQNARFYAAAALAERNKLGTTESLNDEEAKAIAGAGLKGLMDGVGKSLTGGKSDPFKDMKSVYATAIPERMTGYDAASFAKAIAGTPGTMEAFSQTAQQIGQAWSEFSLPTVQNAAASNLEELVRQATDEIGRFNLAWKQDPKTLRDQDKLRAVINVAMGEYGNLRKNFKYQPPEPKK